MFKLYVDLILFFSKAIGKKSNTVVDANNITNILKRGKKIWNSHFLTYLKGKIITQTHTNSTTYLDLKMISLFWSSNSCNTPKSREMVQKWEKRQKNMLLMFISRYVKKYEKSEIFNLWHWEMSPKSLVEMMIFGRHKDLHQPCVHRWYSTSNCWDICKQKSRKCISRGFLSE